jgi:DNA replication protein DnaC
VNDATELEQHQRSARVDRSASEFLFQVIAERAEKAAVIVTTNLPFSEWTSVIPNARLCKALIDRITDRANIIETGTESYRFRRTLDKRKGKATENKT